LALAKVQKALLYEKGERQLMLQLTAGMVWDKSIRKTQ